MKIGLVLEGGASRTVYSCGVQDAMMEAGIDVDYIIGTSAGITYGVCYASNQPGRNIQVATEYMSDKRYMGMRHLLNRKNRSFYNIPFAFEEIPNKLVPFDFEAFRAFPGETIAVVTNIHTGKAEYLSLDRNDTTFTELVATCALPILFQPVKIGNKYYLDGGLADSVPYEKALEDGCDKLVVILTRERDYVKKTDRISHLSAGIYRKYPKVKEDILNRAESYNRNMKKLYELEQQGKVYVIAPKTTMGVGRTERNPEILQKLYQEGYEQAKEEMEKLKQYLGGNI